MWKCIPAPWCNSSGNWKLHSVSPGWKGRRPDHLCTACCCGSLQHAVHPSGPDNSLAARDNQCPSCNPQVRSSVRNNMPLWWVQMQSIFVNHISQEFLLWFYILLHLGHARHIFPACFIRECHIHITCVVQFILLDLIRETILYVLEIACFSWYLTLSHLKPQKKSHITPLNITSNFRLQCSGIWCSVYDWLPCHKRFTAVCCLHLQGSQRQIREFFQAEDCSEALVTNRKWTQLHIPEDLQSLLTLLWKPQMCPSLQPSHSSTLLYTPSQLSSDDFHKKHLMAQDSSGAGWEYTQCEQSTAFIQTLCEPSFCGIRIHTSTFSLQVFSTLPSIIYFILMSCGCLRNKDEQNALFSLTLS